MPDQKKSHKKRQDRTAWNKLRAEERAQAFFLIYEQMGTTRTLKRLWGVCRSVGVEISLKTLETYSSKYGWQAKILERAARQESAEFVEIKDAVERMNEEHARTFQDIGALVKAGIQAYQDELVRKVQAGLPATLDIDLLTIGKLAQTYQYGERLARGLATSKAQVIVEVLPPLVKDIYAVFLAVNVITKDPPELVQRRESEFIQRGDQVLIQYYGQTTPELPESGE